MDLLKVGRMIIITGNGRCGTSLLASFCKSMGYDPGGQMLPGEVNAGMEDPLMSAINWEITQAIIRQQDLSWETRKRMLAYDRRLVKCPRFLWHSGKVLRAWRSVRTDFNVLLLIREPREIVQSLYRHQELFKLPARPYAEVEQEIRDYLQAFLDVLAEFQIEFRTLHFPDFLLQYDRVFNCLTELGLDFSYEAGKASWERLVDFEKVRYTPNFPHRVDR